MLWDFGWGDLDFDVPLYRRVKKASTKTTKLMDCNFKVSDVEHALPSVDS